MKYYFTTLIVLTIICLAACNNKTETKTDAAADSNAATPGSAIEGNWILVSTEVNGEQVNSEKGPRQFKMFHDGHFSFIMFDSSGKFYLAGAGPYEIEGDMYKETQAYISDTVLTNAKDWQKWEMKADTLIFYGFEKTEMADGKDVTQEWNGGGKFIEKRVRLK
jgi:hypothetical protein